MKEFNKKTGNEILNTLLLFAVIIALLGFIWDIRNTISFGGVDLRNRVVAARLLIEGIDPYYFKWKQGMSELFLDPGVNPSWPVSRATIPPTVLLLHTSIAKLSYMYQKVIWFFFQWILLLSTLAIFAKAINSGFKSKIILFIGLFFFSGSYFWRLHVERGQIYILYVFLISCAYWIMRENLKFNSVLSGLLIGLTASLRLPILLMFIPMLIYKKWNLFFGAVVGLFLAILCSFSLGGLAIWKSYFSAMKLWEKVHSGLIEFKGGGNWVDSDPAYPQTVEGMNNMVKVWGTTGVGSDTSFQYIIKSLEIVVPPNIFILTLCIILLIMSFWLYKNRKQNNTTDLLFLSGTFMVLVGEHFIPAIRSTYNDIQWLFPVLLIITISDLSKFLLNKISIILLFGLFCSIGFTWLPKTEYISDLMMLLYTGLMILYIDKNNKTNALL